MIMPQADAIVLACPRCHRPFEPSEPDVLCCAADGLTFRRVSGIWRLLLPEREPYYQQFMREYESVRKAEGRGSASRDYYQALPYRDLSGSWSADWAIRAASFDAFVHHAVLPLEKRLGGGLAVADLGSGNGWLSNRMALRGHASAAVDLLLNEQDGLGCHPYYAAPFLPVQAEFDALPFGGQSFSLVVFNASFHYSSAYERTLQEALRVLKRGGSLVLLDSPIYQDASSGERMVRERETQFQQRYGFPSNSLHSENYLTYARLKDLAARLKMTMKIVTPRYGPRWLLRRLKARILSQREAANFHLVMLTDAGEPSGSA